MSKIAITLFAALILGLFASVSFAQRVTRITFRRGATTRVVTGSLNGYKAKQTFLIRVRRGQTLTTENSNGNPITVGIDAPRGSTYEQDMAADCHDHNEVSPTAAGDYKITVTECQKADRWRGRFRLRVTVR